MIASLDPMLVKRRYFLDISFFYQLMLFKVDSELQRPDKLGQGRAEQGRAGPGQGQVR